MPPVPAARAASVASTAFDSVTRVRGRTTATSHVYWVRRLRFVRADEGEPDALTDGQETVRSVAHGDSNLPAGLADGLEVGVLYRRSSGYAPWRAHRAGGSPAAPRCGAFGV